MTHTLAPGWTALDLTKENLRLYAAAPELLEALKALADAVSNGATTVATLDAVGKARAAIAKAEGKE